MTAFHPHLAALGNRCVYLLAVVPLRSNWLQLIPRASTTSRGSRACRPCRSLAAGFPHPTPPQPPLRDFSALPPPLVRLLCCTGATTTTTCATARVLCSRFFVSRPLPLIFFLLFVSSFFLGSPARLPLSGVIQSQLVQGRDDISVFGLVFFHFFILKRSLCCNNLDS